MRLRNIEPRGISRSGCDHDTVVQDLREDLRILRPASFHRNAHTAGPGHIHPDALGIDMLLAAHMQTDFPVDAAARIPTGIGCFGVIRNDGNMIRRPAKQPPGKIHIKIRVAVGPEGDLLSVQQDLGVLIHAFAFQHHMLPCPVRRDLPCLLIDILAAVKISAGTGRRRLPAALLKEHGIMRKIHTMNLLVPIPTHCPVTVKIQCVHSHLPIIPSSSPNVFFYVIILHPRP